MTYEFNEIPCVGEACSEEGCGGTMDVNGSIAVCRKCGAKKEVKSRLEAKPSQSSPKTQHQRGRSAWWTL